MHYLSKYYHTTAEKCEPLRRLTSVKAVVICNNMNQELYDKIKDKEVTIGHPLQKYDSNE